MVTSLQRSIGVAALPEEPHQETIGKFIEAALILWVYTGVIHCRRSFPGSKTNTAIELYFYTSAQGEALISGELHQLATALRDHGVSLAGSVNMNHVDMIFHPWFRFRGRRLRWA